MFVYQRVLWHVPMTSCTNTVASWRKSGNHVMNPLSKSLKKTRDFFPIISHLFCMEKSTLTSPGSYSWILMVRWSTVCGIFIPCRFKKNIPCNPCRWYHVNIPNSASWYNRDEWWIMSIIMFISCRLYHVYPSQIQCQLWLLVAFFGLPR